MTQQLTLGGFIKQLAVLMQDADIKMSFKDDKPWHMLFYKLRGEFKSQGNTFLQSMQFDWDGPYPKSQDVSDFLQGLHWTGSVSALNPTYERIIVPDEVQKVWKAEGESLGDADRDLLLHGLAIARLEFRSSIAA
ncbi:MAG TPA: hypothetical protein VHX63_11285 [Acidobacteriaceae bacterium]|jgi:hypothetical protein|nr:hypothetical protein [Acidobacteriaceae bacterium]